MQMIFGNVTLNMNVFNLLKQPHVYDCFIDEQTYLRDVLMEQDANFCNDKGSNSNLLGLIYGILFFFINDRVKFHELFVGNEVTIFESKI